MCRGPGDRVEAQDHEGSITGQGPGSLPMRISKPGSEKFRRFIMQAFEASLRSRSPDLSVLPDGLRPGGPPRPVLDQAVMLHVAEQGDRGVAENLEAGRKRGRASKAPTQSCPVKRATRLERFANGRLLPNRRMPVARREYKPMQPHPARTPLD